MSLNLLDTVKNYFTPEFINQASAGLGESNTGISKALSGMIPTGLAGIIHRATSGNEGAGSIFNMAKDAAGKIPPSANFNILSNTQTASGHVNILSDIFGINKSGIEGIIARFAGIKESSAAAVMGMGLPAIMGILGKHAEQNNLSASGLSGFLSSQKDQIMNAMPLGLSSIAGMLGLGHATAGKKSGILKRRKDVSGFNKWLGPVIFIVVAIAILVYVYQGCSKTADLVPITEKQAIVKADTVAVTPTSPELIKVKLPNGKVLEAFKGGIEDQLVAFLSGSWQLLSNDSLKEKWFNFDNLNFNTGKATLLPESEKQLNNITEILKAFPGAKIKIGGYTDAVGDAAANKKLSQDRADAARAGLVKLGAGARVTDAEGYGSEFAKYPATASELERLTDRHVSVSVRK